MRSRILLNLVVLGAVVALPHRVHAQSIDQVATMPPNVVLGNYDSVPVGPFGGLEGGAYVARVSDPSAAWFNPAGLAREPRAQISASAGVYKWIAVSPEHLPHSGGSVQNVPNFVGGTFHLRGALNGGAVFLTTNAWLQEIDSELFTSVSERPRASWLFRGFALCAADCSRWRRVPHRQGVASGCRVVTVHDGAETGAGHQRPSR